MLSICIPTYKRTAFLNWTFTRLRNDFPNGEIVISDNAANYGETRPISDKCRYFAQAQNIGPFPNMLAALRGSTRQYAVYCGDDDYLLPDEVAKGIEYLERHPEVAAYCAPCEIYNEVEQRAYWNAFKVPNPVTFKQSQGVDLFNFLIQYHVWPEHIIYRTPVPLKPRTRAYWAFADLIDILATGAIHFSPTPFYRNLLVHPLGERTQLGNEQCLTHFDEYRAGLEVLACGLFGDSLPYAARHRIQEMISSFICQRLNIARQLNERKGNTAEAEMIKKRLAIANPARDLQGAA